MGKLETGKKFSSEILEMETLLIGKLGKIVTQKN